MKAAAVKFLALSALCAAVMGVTSIASASDWTQHYVYRPPAERYRSSSVRVETGFYPSRYRRHSGRVYMSAYGRTYGSVYPSVYRSYYSPIVPPVYGPVYDPYYAPNVFVGLGFGGWGYHGWGGSRGGYGGFHSGFGGGRGGRR